MKQIKIASPAKDRQKLLEEKLQTSPSGQISITKKVNAGTYHFSNIPELSCLTCFDVTF